ncbi:hypothetical protein [Salinibacterium sp. ZJ77]|uniref:DUF6993 domain-containing protein n=1 Tax=Salinibacterium sp. ZJ77 TaxID=2708337 RepID=UPI0014239CDB|nr:hypothetical protein [Salinibacterium sp. ZJ77]
MRRPRRTTAAVILVAASLALVGCTAAAPAPTTAPVESPGATPTPEPTVAPEPVFDGTATDNKAFFDWVNEELIASGTALNGAAFVDNLEGAGFPRDVMEVTPDTTSIGIAADNIVFSIRFGEECLLGQWGNIGYTSMVAPVLSTGRCLVGTERPA